MSGTSFSAELQPQLVARLEDPARGRWVVISAAKELEPGARAALLLAPGLFRFDIVIVGDTLRTVIRNMSGGEIEVAPQHYSDPANNIAFGGNVPIAPVRVAAAFVVRKEDDRVDVEITLGTMPRARNGTVRVLAQAVLRHTTAH